MDVVFHPRFLDHQQYPGHPERPERLSVVFGALARAELDPPMREPSPVDPALLERVHTAAHVARLDAIGEGFYDADTYVRPETMGIARLAAGAAPLAVDIAREAGAAIALVRPPGHHAGADYAGGFCYLNNAALAAEHARSRDQRVAVVDIDVHHGNGTADIFARRADVLYVSTHEYGIYPGTGHYGEVGKGDGEGFTVNVGLPGGNGDRTFSIAFDRVVMPVLEQHDPGFLVVSVGVDAHYTDPIAGMGLTSEGYMALVRRLRGFAADRSIGVAFLLEGGYSLPAMAEVVGNIVALDMANPVPAVHNEGRDSMSGVPIVDRLVGVLSRYWDLG